MHIESKIRDNSEDKLFMIIIIMIIIVSLIFVFIYIFYVSGDDILVKLKDSNNTVKVNSPIIKTSKHISSPFKTDP